MKNIQPLMDLSRQVRKATEDLTTAMYAGQYHKARYILSLMEQMIEGAKVDEPQPWSHFQPMVLEEFDD